MGRLTWLSAHYWYVYGAGCALMLLLVTIRLVGGRRRVSRSVSHGSARWATAKEVQQVGLLTTEGVMLGRYKAHYLRENSDTHMLLIAPTRAGKGVGPVICTLLTWMESILVTDPKDGENFDVTANWRRGLGPVYAFTPRRNPQTRINVLDTVRLQTSKEFGDAQLIAQSLVAPEKLARESQTSLHFRELAALLTATILHVLYTGKRKSLAGVWGFLTQQHTSLGAALKTMASARHLSHGVHEAIASMTTAIKNITGDRELSSVWTTAIRPLVLYSDPLVAASTDASDFRFDELQYGARPVSLYLIAPSPLELERLHPLYRVVLDVAMQRLMEHKVRTWKHRLLSVLDEIAWFGYTRAIDKGIAVKAGYGMKDLLVAQDFESLFDVYGQHTAIWGNCRVKVFFAPDNDLTAKRISQNLLGEATVEQPVVHQGGGMQANASTTYQFHGRSLLTPDELMELSSDQEIVRVSGCKPILAQKLDYRTDVNLRRRVLR
ncbi:MAG: type IV secretory system conjugative DNA transfer family protein [Candidatus Tectomicrobia bacterium]|nr:type IV secretory system conjugative DNA transfer family protein [Candidatus Tectomicrobia bacterium]